MAIEKKKLELEKSRLEAEKERMEADERRSREERRLRKLDDERREKFSGFSSYKTGNDLRHTFYNLKPS